MGGRSFMAAASEWGSWPQLCAFYEDAYSCFLFGCAPCSCGLTACYAKNQIAGMIGGPEAEEAGSYKSQFLQCISFLPLGCVFNLVAVSLASLGLQADKFALASILPSGCFICVPLHCAFACL